MENCVFCKIVKKEIPASIVYEDNKTIAFLDIAPASKGHTLVLAKNHFNNISEISDEELKNLMLAVKKISKGLLKFSEGLNIVQNNGKTAGQLVDHIHFHLVPRTEGDDVKIGKWANHKYNKNEMEETANEIRKLLQ